MPEAKEKFRVLGPLAVAGGAGLWGLETIFRVYLQNYFASEVMVFFEHLFAVVVLLPLLFFNRKHFRNFSKRAWIWLLVSGLIGSALGTVLFTSSLKLVNISVATLLLNLQPIVGVAMARLLLGEKIAKGFGRWAILAVASGAVLTFDNLANLEISHSLGLLLVLGTLFCWGTATAAGRGLMLEVPLNLAAPMRLVVGMFGALFLVYLNGKGAALSAQFPVLAKAEVLWVFALFVISIAVIPIFLYFWGLKHTQAVASTFCEMFQAIVAVVVSWAVLGHALKAHQILAAAFLILGVVKINLLQAKLSSVKTLAKGLAGFLFICVSANAFAADSVIEFKDLEHLVRKNEKEAKALEIDDPVYKKRKKFLAIPLGKIVNLETANDEIIFQAKDGFAPSIPAEKFKTEKAYLAFRDLSFDGRGWEPIPQGKKKVDPAPYYLVWESGAKLGTVDYAWPYQIVRIESVSFQEKYPKVFPMGVRAGDAAYRGFETFKTVCIACHAMNEQGGFVGPELNVPKNVTEYWTDANLKSFIRDASAFRYNSKMPTFSQLSDTQIDDLVHYLKAMRDRKVLRTSK